MSGGQGRGSEESDSLNGEPYTGAWSQEPEVVAQAKTKSWMLNWQSHPGAPGLSLLRKKKAYNCFYKSCIRYLSSAPQTLFEVCKS